MAIATATQTGIVFDQDGVTVTKDRAARLSGRAYTYTVAGHGVYDYGFIRKSDAIAAAKQLVFISKVV